MAENKSNKLQPHQERALAKLDLAKGLILDHSTGSGKTRSFLEAVRRAQAESPKKRSLIIAPASLVTNVDKELDKHGIKLDKSKLDVMSYEMAVNRAKELGKNDYNIAVMDEAHKMRNTGTARHKYLSHIVANADKRLLATATTSYNHVSDIAPLVNIAAGYKSLPEGKKEFEKHYVNKVIEQPPMLKRVFGASPIERHVLKNTKELKARLKEVTDTYDLSDDIKAKGSFPERIERTIEVPMSGEQIGIYKYLEGKIPFHLRMKIRMNMPLDKKESASLNAFSTGIRQVSNSTKPYLQRYEGISPKVKTAVDSLEARHKSDKNFRGLVYSNYLKAGLEDYSEELGRRGIPHTVYTGALSSKQKDEAKEAFNSGKVPVMLISSSGAEGLDLKGTKLIQVLEPHYNASKIAQIMGRGVRYKSHDHLPPAERKVEVEHYLSVFNKPTFDFMKRPHSIDEYLKHNSHSKEELTNQMKDLVKQSAVSVRNSRTLAMARRITDRLTGTPGNALQHSPILDRALDAAKKLTGGTESVPSAAFSNKYVSQVHNIINSRAANPDFARPYAKYVVRPEYIGKGNTMVPHHISHFKDLGEAGW